LSIFIKAFEEIKVSLKSATSKRFFIRGPLYFCDHIWLSSSYNEKRFRQKL